MVMCRGTWTSWEHRSSLLGIAAAVLTRIDKCFTIDSLCSGALAYRRNVTASDARWSGIYCFISYSVCRSIENFAQGIIRLPCIKMNNWRCTKCPNSQWQTWMVRGLQDAQGWRRSLTSNNTAVTQSRMNNKTINSKDRGSTCTLELVWQHSHQVSWYMTSHPLWLKVRSER